jgi:hypothetical protein
MQYTPLRLKCHRFGLSVKDLQSIKDGMPLVLTPPAK